MADISTMRPKSPAREAYEKWATGQDAKITLFGWDDELHRYKHSYAQEQWLTFEAGFLSSAKEPQTEGWRDIASAPKDGTRVLVGRFAEKPHPSYPNNVVEVDYWHERKHNDYEGWGRFNPQFWPATHWMPLPALPSSGGGHE